MIIIDDFLCDDFVEHIQDVIPNLGYTPHGSVGKLNFFNSIGTWPQTDAFNYVSKKIKNLIYIKNVSIGRVYVNLHPSGINHGGVFHVDEDTSGRFNETITALYYPYDWDEKYGGGTEFEDGTIVEYKRNRLVLFGANKKHRGMEHSNPDMFRYTVAFKMNAEWV